MSTHIEIVSSASRYGASMRSLIAQMRAAQELAQECKDIGDQLAFGGDFTTLAAYLGLSGPTAEADAESVYNLLGSANTELHGTFVTQMLSRLG